MIRFYVIQTEGHSLEASFPDYSEKLLGRSTVFSTVLYLVRTKNIKQGYISSKFQKKNKKTWTARTQWVGMALAPGKGVLIIKGGPELASQEGRYLIFIFSMDMVYFWPMCPFL